MRLLDHALSLGVCLLVKVDSDIVNLCRLCFSPICTMLNAIHNQKIVTALVWDENHTVIYICCKGLCQRNVPEVRTEKS